MQLSSAGDNKIDLNAPLPQLRPDLEIVAGPSALNGSPTYTIYDPVPRSFSKVGWSEAIILELLRRPATLASLQKKLTDSSTIRLSDQELLNFIDQANLAGLTTAALIQPVEKLMARSKATRLSIFNWLLKNYLYIRIPLLRPDRFLSETLGIARLLVSRPAIILYLTFGLLGLSAMLRNFALYLSTFPYFFNLNGMIWYGGFIIIIKTIHEFSHAYTAKNFGVRVPVMGIAFMVMWPVAFCDVTDGWRLSDRKQRAAIATAGIKAEIIMAGLALFGWSVSPPGVFNSICFVVSSTSLISTLTVNLNPAMSFDGYFILMDLWGVDNLRPRAFATTRWFYRKKLLGIDNACPEKNLKTRRLCAFICYSVYAWLYRLVLYLGIAVLVYYKFTKTLGLFLFIVEIWWFILKPLGMEMKSIIQIRKSIHFTWTGVTLLALLAAILIWGAAPLKHDLKAPAVIVPGEMQVVHAPSAGQLLDINVRKGDFVSKGQVLAVFHSRELETALAEARNRLAILTLEHSNLQLDAISRALLPQKDEEIEQAESKLAGLEKKLEEQRVKARMDGMVLWWDENLHKGSYVGKDVAMGRIANQAEILVRAFVEEKNISSIHVGDFAKFYPASAAGPVSGEVTRISPARSENVEHIALTSLSQGVIPVAPDEKGRMNMVDSYYVIEIKPEPKSSLLIGQSGTARLRTKPKSLLLSWLRSGYNLLLRESGF
ncbi:HlyD family efflux transporter periplasmic adaptor subunit [Maridesulfovibrio sp.]|uniref:HlyD family efflux transporter periplasmic adaptor subunit n=1 Tax=Maridesulfovibrio sp. TaxID=2795000 RepID=UPI0039EEC0BA